MFAMRKCDELTEALVRSGFREEALPEGLRRHASECGLCRETLENARLLNAGLQELPLLRAPAHLSDPDVLLRDAAGAAQREAVRGDERRGGRGLQRSRRRSWGLGFLSFRASRPKYERERAPAGKAPPAATGAPPPRRRAWRLIWPVVLLVQAGMALVIAQSDDSQDAPEPVPPVVATETLHPAKSHGTDDLALEAVSFSPAGDVVVAAGKSTVVHVWMPEAGQAIELRGHSDTIRSIAFSPDGRLVVTAGDDETIRLWQLPSGAPFAVLPGGGKVAKIAFARHTWRLASASAVGVRVRDLSSLNQPGVTANPQQDFPAFELALGPGGALDVAFSQDGTRLAAGGADGRALIWDASKGGDTVWLEGHSKAIRSVRFSADGARIVTGSSDGTARIWGAESGTQQAILHNHFCKGPVRTAEFSPDGKRVLTTHDGAARLWDVSGRLVVKLPGHEFPVVAGAFNPDGRCIATVGEDNTARFWDGSSGSQLAILREHHHAVRAVAFSSTEHVVVTVGDDGNVLLSGACSSRFASAR